MKREETLLSAMGGMEAEFLMEAENYGKKRRRTLRKGMIAIAAAAALMITSTTALAANESWRDTIRGWFGIGESGASGYEEYDDQTVQMGDLKLQQLNELCSGNQLVAFIEVTPRDGETVPEEISFGAQVMDEQLWLENINTMNLDVVSRSAEDALLKLTVDFEDMAAVKQFPVRYDMYPDGTYGADWEEADVIYSEPMELKIVDTPMLSGDVHLPLENDAADSAGELMTVRLCSGSLEVIAGYEYFETWCTRVCVPDSGKTFMERYTGKEWTPGTPEFDGEVTPYFTEEDEISIGTAFSATWEDTIGAILDTVTVTLKDGTVMELQDSPTVSYNAQYSENGVGAFTYRYTILPLISLDDVATVEIGGEVLEMELMSQAG